MSMLVRVALLLTCCGSMAAAQCPGDCNGDGTVSVNELIRAVNIALGRADLSQCVAADANHNGSISISELITAVNAALTGCPPEPTATSTPSASSTPTATATATIVNEPPAIDPLGVYRSYPGLPIEYTIAASDPEGGDLVFESNDLPEGATLDRETGVFSWTPAEDQTGAYEIDFDCSDELGASSTGTLPIRISGADSCAASTCDPATGCGPEVLPISENCCTGEPVIRVAEPSAECPQGLVLYAGRNMRGFGRLQNCDLLQIRNPVGQGSSDVRFHVEARCLNSDNLVRVTGRMETSDLVIFDRGPFFVSLDDRDDGFAQELALSFPVQVANAAFLEGREVLLTLTLVDFDGLVVSHQVRLTLTLSSPGDLPDADREEVSPAEAGCIGCHRPYNSSGDRFGIEEAHPWAQLTCTGCHGGNGSSTLRASAHVAPNGGPSFLRNLTSDQLDAVDPDYLRFINPGDLRVAAQTCGPAGCHPDHVANVAKSVMSTYGAQYTVPRYLAGVQDRQSIYGAVDIVDETFDAATAPAGAIPELVALRGPTTPRNEIEGVLDEILPKACPTCHVQAFGANNAAGTYRSSGCTSCHMVYDDDGLSRSADPQISQVYPPRPAAHELTTAIPVEQCAHCHFEGGRIGLAYRGIREGGFSRTPDLPRPLGTPLYGHGPDFYFDDEDTLNFVDETPPDLHFDAGMVCVDCHVGGDVHGDGNLYGSKRYRTGIRCEDCHGTVRAPIAADAEGVFRTSGGDPLRRLRRDDDGDIQLRLAMQDRELEVTQIEERIAAATNPRMVEAMGVHDGFSHTDSVECYTCHTSWRQTCFGCHVIVDDRGTRRNQTTGEVTMGSVSPLREDYSLDFFAVGVNERGKLAPLASAMSMFFSYADADGTQFLDKQVRTSGDGLLGFGWSPLHSHTVSRIPQNCDRCHSLDDVQSPTNEDVLCETYGFGNGQVMLEDGSGTLYDATGFLDDDGELRSDFPHANTGPVPADMRQRALDVVVVAQPR